MPVGSSCSAPSRASWSRAPDEVDRDEARALRDRMLAIIQKLETGLGR
jgi:hypothetical protein